MKSKASKFCGGALAVVMALLGLAGSAFFALLVLLIPVNALADTVVPSNYATSLKAGKSVTITKTVTISAGSPTSAKVDVFFLADTTGSMGGTLASVQTGAAAIMAGIAGLGDVAYGVGEYKDDGATPRPFCLSAEPGHHYGYCCGSNRDKRLGGVRGRRLGGGSIICPCIRWPTPLPGGLVPPVSSSGLGMLQATIPPDPLRELPRRKPPPL